MKYLGLLSAVFECSSTVLLYLLAKWTGTSKCVKMSIWAQTTLSMEWSDTERAVELRVHCEDIPTIAVYRDFESTDYVLPTVSWTARKGATKVFFIIRNCIAFYILLIIWRKLPGDNNGPALWFLYLGYACLIALSFLSVNRFSWGHYLFFTVAVMSATLSFCFLVVDM